MLIKGSGLVTLIAAATGMGFLLFLGWISMSTSVQVDMGLIGMVGLLILTLIGAYWWSIKYEGKQLTKEEASRASEDNPVEPPKVSSGEDALRCACGQELSADFEFCPKCGEPLLHEHSGGITEECSCGYVNDSGYAFCPNCGDALEQREKPEGKGLVPATKEDRFLAWLVESVFFALPIWMGESFYFLLLPVWAWEIWCWTKSTSIGKQLFGLTAVNAETHEKVSVGTMFLREVIFKTVSGLALGIGYLWVAIDEDRQGWHDKLAGTVVIKDTSDGNDN